MCNFSPILTQSIKQVNFRPYDKLELRVMSKEKKREQL